MLDGAKGEKSKVEKGKKKGCGTGVAILDQLVKEISLRR